MGGVLPLPEDEGSSLPSIGGFYEVQIIFQFQQSVSLP